MNIDRFFQYSLTIACSALPKVEEFKEIKEHGYELVISLSMPTDSVILENEDKILAELEIPYFHIPVDANNPKMQDFEIFLKLLNSFEGYKIYIHCTKNCRLSSFIYLYDAIKREEFNEKLLYQFCEPRKEWLLFIDRVIEKYKIKG